MVITYMSRTPTKALSTSSPWVSGGARVAETPIVIVDAYVPVRMPECQNCGSFVTTAYARVFTPDGVENPRVCPNCEDKIREGAGVREARSTRRA